MDLPLKISILLLLLTKGTLTLGSTFTFVNKCDFTVWPGILANAGTPKLDSTGFQLPTGFTKSFQAPTGWSGRFWARTGCNFDGSGSGSCLTADCGSGQVECNGAGASPPATLAEFTLGVNGGRDFYDVSLVDGYNVAMIVEAVGGGGGGDGSGLCETTGCVTDLNRECPAELRVGDGYACRSACEAFGSPEYCCSGAFSTPERCKPSVYSEMFKMVCPRSYSYAYDDPTSTFTCLGADYTITFCPSLPSQKSTQDSPSSTAAAATTTGSTNSPDSFTTAGGGGISSGDGSGSEAMLADGSWLAGLAMGGSTGLHHMCFFYFLPYLLLQSLLLY